MQIIVYNLSTEEELILSNVTPIYAVACAFASDRGMLTILFDLKEKAKSNPELDSMIKEKFPIAEGVVSVGCGDWATSTTKSMSDEEKKKTIVCLQIKSFLIENIESFRRDAREYGELDLTFAVDDDFSEWSFQTGDNSFIGGAYLLPHWAVTTIMPDSDPLEVYKDVIDQLEDLTSQ